MSDYNTDFYNERGGAKRIIKSGGELEGQSGGEFDAQEGFEFFFGGSSDYVLSEIMGAFLRGRQNVAYIGQSQGLSAVLSAAGGSSPPVLPSFYGYIFFSIGGISANSASARMWSGHKGEEVLIRLLGSMSTAQILIVASNSGFTGVSIEGGLTSAGGSHVALSAFIIKASATSNPWVRLVCFVEGTWSVVERSDAGIVEYPAA